MNLVQHAGELMGVCMAGLMMMMMMVMTMMMTMMMMMNKSSAACWRVNGCLYGAGLPTNGLSPCLETRPNAPAGPTRRVRDSECQVVKRVKYYRHS